MLNCLAPLAQAAHLLVQNALALASIGRIRREPVVAQHPGRALAGAIAYLEGSMPLRMVPDERLRSRQEALLLLRHLQEGSRPC